MAKKADTRNRRVKLHRTTLGRTLLRATGTGKLLRSSTAECTSKRCRVQAKRSEQYRVLNEELTQEVANLRLAEKSNREFQVMFDRFTLKFGQSLPRVRYLKKRLEESYDVLLELEEIVDCFADSDRLRGFLMGEESFQFAPAPSVGDDAQQRSPIVKKAPVKDHRRFDEEGEIHTIVEESEKENSRPPESDDDDDSAEEMDEDEPEVEEVETTRRDPENDPGRSLTMTARSHFDRSSGSKSSSERRSSRRSSIGVSSLSVPQSRTSQRVSKTFVRDNYREPEQDVSGVLGPNATIRVLGGTVSQDNFDEASPPSIKNRRETYAVRKPAAAPTEDSSFTLSSPPAMLNRRTITIDKAKPTAVSPRRLSLGQGSSGRMSLTMTVEDSIPTAGKSDEDLSGCRDVTITEVVPFPVAQVQIHERSPTAINVAQMWAAANRPAERRSQTELLREVPLPQPASTGPSFLVPAPPGTLNPSPRQLSPAVQGTGPETSTPAVHGRASALAFGGPSPLGISMIHAPTEEAAEMQHEAAVGEGAAGAAGDLESEIEVPSRTPETVEHRRRKRKAFIVESPVPSVLLKSSLRFPGNHTPANNSRYLRKSVRFSGFEMPQRAGAASDSSPASSKNSPSCSPLVAAVSSPMVKLSNALDRRSKAANRPTQVPIAEKNNDKAQNGDAQSEMTGRRQRVTKKIDYKEWEDDSDHKKPPEKPTKSTTGQARRGRPPKTASPKKSTKQSLASRSTGRAQRTEADEDETLKAEQTPGGDGQQNCESDSDDGDNGTAAATTGAAAQPMAKRSRLREPTEATSLSRRSSLASKSTRGSSYSASTPAREDQPAGPSREPRSSRRRGSGAVSYVEPSLRHKMRRP